jgi:hypothetical protein
LREENSGFNDIFGCDNASSQCSSIREINHFLLTSRASNPRVLLSTTSGKGAKDGALKKVARTWWTPLRNPAL